MFTHNKLYGPNSPALTKCVKQYWQTLAMFPYLSAWWMHTNKAKSVRAETKWIATPNPLTRKIRTFKVCLCMFILCTSDTNSARAGYIQYGRCVIGDHFRAFDLIVVASSLSLASSVQSRWCFEIDHVCTIAKNVQQVFGVCVYRGY